MDNTQPDFVPKIFRGTIDGKAKYCRILVRRKNTVFTKVKPCAVCGKYPEVDEQNNRITCHSCKMYMEDEDADFLVDAWNHMNSPG